MCETFRHAAIKLLARKKQESQQSSTIAIVCVSFRSYSKERRKINERLPMAGVNKTQQTDSGMTDNNELQSTRAGSGMTDTNELQSTRAGSSVTDTELQSTQTHGQLAAEDLKSAAGAIAGRYRSKIEQTWDDARDRARMFQEDANQYVRENPTKTVFTALGIGFILGLIFRR
jgi:ElaB/YqjD/DUF883 family membrane-anchored ribosome-binding protein